MNTNPLPSTQLVKAFGSDSPPENRETSLSIRLEGGSAYGFPYAYLVSMVLNPLTGLLILNFSSHKVTVEGKSLNELYSALLMQSVQFVQVNTGHEIEEGRQKSPPSPLRKWAARPLKERRMSLVPLLRNFRITDLCE